jgi:dTDP-4-dehydrorhamnose 3,5-epimerase
VITPAQYPVTAGTRRLIEGVKCKTLRVIPDDRGWLMEILRVDDEDFFLRFGQAYVSATYPDVVKAWHYHQRQIDNFACVSGMVKLVLIDTRPGSPTEGAVNEFWLGTQNPTLVQVPNLVYHGWKNIGRDVALVVNVPTEPYRYGDPDEYRVDPHGTLPYDWKRKDG